MRHGLILLRVSVKCEFVFIQENIFTIEQDYVGGRFSYFSGNIHPSQMILGTFPKTFFQGASSQGYFPKWHLPNCAISQASTS